MNQFAGKTLNERLFLSGKLDVFEKAVKSRNVQIIREILENLGVDKLSIIQITKKVTSQD